MGLGLRGGQEEVLLLLLLSLLLLLLLLLFLLLRGDQAETEADRANTANIILDLQKRIFHHCSSLSAAVLLSKIITTWSE